MVTMEIEENASVSPITLSHKKVHQFAWGSFAAGLLPSVLPGGVMLDFAGVFGVQMAMIKHLADGYGVPFRKDLAKQTVGGLLGALAAAKLGYGGVGASLAALMAPVPLVGSVLKLSVAPGFNYLSTVAVGRVFEKHFAEGGTFLDFDLESAKGRIVNEYQAAQSTVKEAMSSVRSENASLKQEIERLKAELSAKMPSGGQTSSA